MRFNLVKQRIHNRILLCKEGLNLECVLQLFLNKRECVVEKIAGLQQGDKLVKLYSRLSKLLPSILN
ncbi:hypothetical protein [Cedratvirus kamchatka]|uniref:Uncharacterized protein n=1 Tax=Cedratvirus kamchatka TaxID=2716914 RepID=A0A6G8MXS9_9VIRU|nr:hypothetical protein [Cedratvirus kamchatka]